MVLLKKHDDHIEVFGEISFENLQSTYEKGLNYLRDSNQSGNIIFDFKNLKSLDSSPLVLLTQWVGAAKKIPVGLSFQKIPRSILNLARVYGIEAILPVIPDEENN